MKVGSLIISSRALALNQIINALDDEIKTVREAGGDVSELKAERKRRADECMVYLSQAVTVTRKNKADYADVPTYP